MAEDFVWDGSWVFDEHSETGDRWDTECVKDQADFVVSAKVHADICEGFKALSLVIVFVMMACHNTAVDLREELLDLELIYYEDREKWMRGADATDRRSPGREDKITTGPAGRFYNHPG